MTGLLQFPSAKANANEHKYPYVVELAVPAEGLDIGLSRRIMDFHKTRHIQPRHGHGTIPGEGEARYDLGTAQSFVERFGGTIIQNTRSKSDEAQLTAANIAKLPECGRSPACRAFHVPKGETNHRI